MEGRGVFRWPNGRVYEGNFVNNKKSGNGKMTWPEGNYYDGEWEEGLQHGRGFYCSQDGTERRG